MGEFCSKIDDITAFDGVRHFLMMSDGCIDSVTSSNKYPHSSERVNAKGRKKRTDNTRNIPIITRHVPFTWGILLHWAALRWNHMYRTLN